MEPLHSDDPRQLGPFLLLGRLGAGGMGQVYLGRDPGERLAAVKIVHPGYGSDPSFRARFAREISTAQGVRAPWTAAVVAADPHAPRPWLATEYVDGPSLEATVNATGPLPGSAIAILAGRLADALAALHATGIVHRDIKPSNVLLAADGPRLIDFGIARAIDSTSVTHSGVVVGTPAFMSPEQALGEDAGPPSDVFSLAAVLVYAATGSGPFGRTSSPVAMLLRITDREPDLSAVAPEWRGRLEACLAKDPAQRPSSRDLAAALATPPVAAPVDIVKHPQAALVADEPAARRRRWQPWMTAACAGVALGVALTLVLLLDRPVVTAVPAARPAATTAAAGSPATALRVGKLPQSVAITPDGARAYTADFSGVSVIDIAAGTVTATIGMASRPQALAVSPDGTRLYIVQQSGFLTVLDTAGNGVITTVPIGHLPYDATISPDGSRLYVSYLQDPVSVLDTATGAVVATVPVDATRVSAAPDGTHLYAFQGDQRSLSVIDTATGTVSATLPIAVEDVAFSADGARAYVLDGFRSITVLDAARSAVIGTIRDLPGRPVDVTVAHDGRHLFVTHTGTDGVLDAVSVLDAASTFVVRGLPLTITPSAAALSSDGRKLVVAGVNTDSVQVLDTGMDG